MAPSYVLLSCPMAYAPSYVLRLCPMAFSCGCPWPCHTSCNLVLSTSCGPVLCPMAVSHVQWPVLCLMALSKVHSPVLVPMRNCMLWALVGHWQKTTIRPVTTYTSLLARLGPALAWRSPAQPRPGTGSTRFCEVLKSCPVTSGGPLDCADCVDRSVSSSLDSDHICAKCKTQLPTPG